jgi:two-component system KDP operon response regulator KdpE
MTDVQALILLVEDDLQTRKFLKSSLSNRGWDIAEAETGKAGLTAAKTQTPDLFVLDLGLPDIDGLSVIRGLRQFTDKPILILSARDQESDKIKALDAGADDYLTKPFSVGELDARIRALLRRVSREISKPPVFQVVDLTVDLSQRKVFKAGQEIHLTPTEFQLLAILARHAGLVVTQRHLLKEVWGPEHVQDSHYLRIYMGQLRHKLEADPARPRFLLTEVGVGYRLLENAD